MAPAWPSSSATSHRDDSKDWVSSSSASPPGPCSCHIDLAGGCARGPSLGTASERTRTSPTGAVGLLEELHAPCQPCTSADGRGPRGPSPLPVPLLLLLLLARLRGLLPLPGVLQAHPPSPLGGAGTPPPSPLRGLCSVAGRRSRAPGPPSPGSRGGHDGGLLASCPPQRWALSKSAWAHLCACPRPSACTKRPLGGIAPKWPEGNTAGVLRTGT